MKKTILILFLFISIVSKSQIQLVNPSLTVEYGGGSYGWVQFSSELSEPWPENYRLVISVWMYYQGWHGPNGWGQPGCTNCWRWDYKPIIMKYIPEGSMFVGPYNIQTLWPGIQVDVNNWHVSYIGPDN